MASGTKFDTAFLRIAATAAVSLSKDPTTKVGAVVATPDQRQFSLGYNGFPVGMAETPQRWERPAKYSRVVHAEINSILNCPFDTKGCTMYCTITPCTQCLHMMRNARIERVVFLRAHRAVETKDMELWKEAASLFPGTVQQLSDPIAEYILSTF